MLYPDVPDPPAPQPGNPPRPAAPSRALVGTWTGRLVHYDGDVPLRVTAKGDGAIDVAFGSRSPLALKDTTLNDTNISGRVEASLRTQDGYYGPSELRFTLSLRDGRLLGVCSAYVSNYFTLPYWVELDRAR